MYTSTQHAWCRLCSRAPLVCAAGLPYQRGHKGERGPPMLDQGQSMHVPSAGVHLAQPSAGQLSTRNQAPPSPLPPRTPGQLAGCAGLPTPPPPTSFSRAAVQGAGLGAAAGPGAAPPEGGHRLALRPALASLGRPAVPRGAVQHRQHHAVPLGQRVQLVLRLGPAAPPRCRGAGGEPPGHPETTTCWCRAGARCSTCTAACEWPLVPGRSSDGGGVLSALMVPQQANRAAGS